MAEVAVEIEKVLKAAPDKRMAEIKKLDIFCQFKDTCKSVDH